MKNIYSADNKNKNKKKKMHKKGRFVGLFCNSANRNYVYSSQQPNRNFTSSV